MLGPALFSILIGYLSWDLSYTVAPWANRNMELMVHNLSQVKPEASIKAGVFSEGFFDMVVYANKVDNESGVLKDLFIFDERNEQSPLTIIAKEGKVHRSKTLDGKTGFLRLKDGNVHRSESKNKAYTKLDFNLYDLYLYEANPYEMIKKSLLSHNREDLMAAMVDVKLTAKRRTQMGIEYHRRFMLAAGCILLTLLGMTLGINANRRSSKGGGFVLSLIVIVTYWVVYIGMENVATAGIMPAWIAIWIPNFGVAALAMYKFRQISRY
jgi:lipopolysaccharide export system permease protein